MHKEKSMLTLKYCYLIAIVIILISDFRIASGSIVYVTPLIEKGEAKSAKEACEVKDLINGIKSYSGLITVNKSYNSNMFFWYFPAENFPETAPLLLWLAGGPGLSGFFGIFLESGPFKILENNTLTLRRYYWSKVLNVLYVDNPVGTGYSFTDHEDGYAKDEVRVGKDLYSALVQFFTVFPELKDRDFYVAGESYAGKYVPAISYTIHKNNKKEGFTKINFKGMAIGNGLCDPISMLNYGDYFYQIGIVDWKGREQFYKLKDEITDDLNSGRYLEAYNKFDIIFEGVFHKGDTLFHNLTGFRFVMNYLHSTDYIAEDVEKFTQYVQTDDVRKKLHVGDLKFHSYYKVAYHLRNDTMKSVKPWIEELVEYYTVVFYSGQLDLEIPYRLTVDFLNTLSWSGAEGYKTAERRQWKVEEQLAGYSKTVKNLTEILVRNAGHLVPRDQPLWTLDLIKRFAFNISF